MYIIWHDCDYDLALWVYENSCLKDKENVILRQIPKTNNEELLSSDFKDKTDYLIIPYIKFATPDILIQKIDGDGKSKVLVVTELMTHTPQHDHIFQRFERIYCIAKEKIPVACILPSKKVKIERGKKDKYVNRYYYPNPLAIHTYLKTTIAYKTPVLPFFWPEKNGYLKFDDNHQTAPKIEGDIKSWFEFFDQCILENDDLLSTPVVKNKISQLEDKFLLGGSVFSSTTFEDYVSGVQNGDYYSLTRIKIYKTEEVIDKHKIDRSKLPKRFLENENTVVLKYDSNKFRTDPYAGFLCGFKNLLCLNNNGDIVNNLVLIPSGINYSDVSKVSRGKTCFTDIKENLNVCPVDNDKYLSIHGVDKLIEHLNEGCIYAKSKHQRIFGTVPDLIIFDDYTYYNNNYEN